MNVQITPAARERMRNFVASESNALGVRFGVRKMGCSGFAYTIDVANEIRDGDIVNEVDGIKLVVDPKSLMPTDYDKRLTAAEFKDLLAFLTRQGTVAPPSPRRGGPPLEQ